MEAPSREHIKYQFCNVYSDLLSDLKRIGNVKPSCVKINDGNEITLAPSPAKKTASATSVHRTRGRSRKNCSEDIFEELKATRSKRKQASGCGTDIKANFDSSFDSTDNESPMKVVAEIHRDASQPPEVPTKKNEPVTSEEVFESLLDKKSNEIEINCSQDSEDFFRVSKKPRKSYPGASHVKTNVLNDGRRLSRRSGLDGFDSDTDSEKAKKKLDKKPASRTSKSFPSINASTSTAANNSDSDKLRSSPGWSRVKAVAKDFKDTNYKKPLNISINRPKHSFSKTSTAATKPENSSVLNMSTSDSDLSDFRYFDSPEATKRYQLMKHVVETVEKNELISTDDVSSAMDPSMKHMVNNLTKNRKEYMKKLIYPTNHSKNRKSIENIDGPEDIEVKGGTEKVSEPMMQNDEDQQLKSPPKTTCLSDLVQNGNQDVPDISNSDNSVLCIGQFDNDQSVKVVSTNEKLTTCEKSFDVSSKKDSMSELSNCDVSEAPLSRDQKSEAASRFRKKSKVTSTDLDNLLTQVLSPSTIESSTYKTTNLVSSQNLCSRCKCSIPDLDLSQNDGSIKTEFSCNDESENFQSGIKRPKKERVNACVQTDDVFISEVRPTKEISVQTMPTPQTLETVPVRTDEEIVRMKDEYVLQTLKSLMIQASHKLTVNDLYNLGLEQENEPPRKKLKEITANHYQSFPKFDDDIVRNENLPHQSWPLPANRGTTSDIPPSNLKTPQNQFIKRKTSTDAKYTSVSTPSSSERKLLDDTKFLSRSTVGLKDVTVYENEEVLPAEDSIMKDVVPMEVEEDPSIVAKSVDGKLEAIDKVPNPEEIESNKLDIVKIKDRMSSSGSNDSMVLSSRKSVRSLNFQNLFTKTSDNASDSPPSAGSLHGNPERHFSNEANSNKYKNDVSLKKMFLPDSSTGDSSSAPNNQVDDMEYSEDIRKSLSVFRESEMDTQKVDGSLDVGIVENSDDESLIQATPNKNKPLTEASLTPDMLSSQNSQLKTGEDTDLQPVREMMKVHSNGESRDKNIEPKPCQADSDNSVSKQPNSNIDSQVNEIPSSLVPTAEDYFSKRVKHKNNFYNTLGLTPNENQTLRTHPLHRNTSNLPAPPVIRPVEGHRPISVTNSSVGRKPNEPQRFFITTSGLPKQFMSGALHEFCKQFDCVYESEITERTTHLVIRTNNNKALSTMKFIQAVAMHKLIVTVDWMVACSKGRKILPEDPYIPLSSSGRPGPLNSLLDKSNAISSPLLKSFIIRVIPPFSNFKKEDFIYMLSHCGAAIAETDSDLAADNSRIRLLLVNNENAEERGDMYRGLVYKYKAFVLTHDWAIESVSNYKIEPFCNHNPLNAVYSFEMVGYFQIPDYIRDLASPFFESNEDSYDDTLSEMSHVR